MNKDDFSDCFLKLSLFNEKLKSAKRKYIQDQDFNAYQKSYEVFLIDI
jgi:hypothetical protein